MQVHNVHQNCLLLRLENTKFPENIPDFTKTDPSTVILTFDWQQWAKMNQHSGKDCLKANRVEKI